MGGKGTRLQLRRKKFITESAGFVSTFRNQHDAVDDEKGRVRHCVNEIGTHDTPMKDESSDGGWKKRWMRANVRMRIGKRRKVGAPVKNEW